jgi:CheY-like chemotaxis protein
MSADDSLIASLVCLVVDDNDQDRDLLTTTLKTIGVKQVMTAANGSEAFTTLVTAAKQRPVDLVLCDIRMPKGNGLQLLHALRMGSLKPMRPDATFILATAVPNTEIVGVAALLDANGFVVKPVAPEKMKAVVLKARRTVFPMVPERYAQVRIPEGL